MIGILYFSSTGNSLYIAQKVQSKLGGQIKYIPNYDGDGSEFERIILVTPIYSYGMPTFVYDMIPKLNKTTEVIVIQNYGGMVCGADYFMYQYAHEQGVNIKAVYVLKMPENFTTTFTVPKFYINRTLKSADERIDKVMKHIISGNYRIPKKCKTKKEVYFKNKSNWHLIGEGFSVTDACVKCGKCVSLCPVDNICLNDGKIVFSDKCVACLGCYHRCPQKAIVYKGKRKKDRYINPNVEERYIGQDIMNGFDEKADMAKDILEFEKQGKTMKKDDIPEKLPMPDLDCPWNKMWDDWANGKLEEPYATLCHYYGDVHGEGLWGFMDNNHEELDEILSNLKNILSEEHYDLFYKAYIAYKNDDENDDETDEDIFNEAEDYFYDHEEELNQLLEKYSEEKYKG